MREEDRETGNAYLNTHSSPLAFFFIIFLFQLAQTRHALLVFYIKIKQFFTHHHARSRVMSHLVNRP